MIRLRFCILGSRNDPVSSSVHVRRPISCYWWFNFDCFTPSSLSPSSVSELQHASRASFFSLSQTYQEACPHPLLSSMKWSPCFLSTLNQAHSIVCHHAVFHVGDKVQRLPQALWAIPRINLGQIVYLLLFFSFLTCFRCVLSILGQTHQLFSNIQCFSTVTFFQHCVIHHHSEIPNSLSALHVSVRGLASNASSQP